jgi:hypothetical protein
MAITVISAMDSDACEAFLHTAGYSPDEISAVVAADEAERNRALEAEAAGPRSFGGALLRAAERR